MFGVRNNFFSPENFVTRSIVFRESKYKHFFSFCLEVLQIVQTRCPGRMKRKAEKGKKEEHKKMKTTKKKKTGNNDNDNDN